MHTICLEADVSTSLIWQLKETKVMRVLTACRLPAVESLSCAPDDKAMAWWLNSLLSIVVENDLYDRVVPLAGLC